jgi:hypothetical protein
MKLQLLVPKIAFALTFAAALSTFGFPQAAKAQSQGPVGLYFNPLVSRISNSTPDSGPFAFLGNNSTSAIFGGVDFGGYYNFAHMPAFDVGVDVRDSIQHGNSATLNSFLLGPRIALRPAAYGLKPYAQLGVGLGRSVSPYSPVATSKLEYAIAAGVDKQLNKHVDFRAIEIGYGSVTTVSSSQHNGNTSIPAARLLNFSTGFVFRLP